MHIDKNNPCPFCGNSDSLQACFNDVGTKYILCHRCGAHGPQYVDRGWYWESRCSSIDSNSGSGEIYHHTGRTFWDWLAEEGDSKAAVVALLFVDSIVFCVLLILFAINNLG